MESVNPAAVPQRRLSNGMVIPGIGMGTFGNDRYAPQEVADAVYGAIKAGYRLLDCAAAYGNERDIGTVLARSFAEGIVQRQELTVMTKLWNDMHGQGDVLVACARSLRDLGLDYVDVYMVHWPFPNYHAPGPCWMAGTRMRFRIRQRSICPYGGRWNVWLTWGLSEVLACLI